MLKTSFLGIIASVLTLQTPVARGQGSADTWGFVNARYDTRSSTTIYAGYGWRRAFAMAGVAHNPRTGYAEQLGGVGVVFHTGPGTEHWLAFASARAGRASLTQIFWLPTIRTGALTTRAQVKWTVPEERSAAQKLSVSPVSMTLPIGRWLASGVAVDMAAAEGARPSVGTGMELRLRLPRAALVASMLRDVQGNGSRQRLLFSSRF